MWKKLIAMIVVCVLCTAPVSAAVSSVPTTTTVYSVTSSEGNCDEYFTVKTPKNEPKTIYVEGKTKVKTELFCIRIKKHKGSSAAITVFVKPNKNGEFKIKINTKKGNKKVPTVIGGKGAVKKAKDCYDTKPGYKAVGKISAGTYHMTITRATTKAQAKIGADSKWYNGVLGGSKGYAYKEFLFKVKKGDENNLRLVKYSAAMKNNTNWQNKYETAENEDASYKGSYVRYTDKYMKDLTAFVLRDPVTDKDYPLTTKKVNYIKKVADDVTKNAKTDYAKLQKIYTYICDKFYYDDLAHIKVSRQYADPYKNLYNLRNKVKSPNSINGKVATTCQGYSAAMIALARAEGIPARMVYGHHISQPTSVWADYSLSKINKTTHYWAEAYVNGRWIILDGNMGHLNTWERSSFTSKGKWIDLNVVNNAGFDPSAEIFANSYLYHGVYPGSREPEFISDKSETAKLKTFLNYRSEGSTNGYKLNVKYSAKKPATWSNGEDMNIETDGFGSVYRLFWAEENLGGTLDVSGFAQLKYVTMYSNRIEKVKLDNCQSLEVFNMNNNKLTSFDSTKAKNLKKISLKTNPLTNVKLMDKNKKITINRDGDAGSFAIVYNEAEKKRLTIYAAKAPKGYTYKGIYNSAGKLVSSSATYAFSPSAAGTYTVKYEEI